MHRTPKSLERPFLRDAIVELRFASPVAVNLLPGMIFERLKGDGWAPPTGNFGSTIALQFGISASTIAEPVLTLEGFRLHILEDRIFFNITHSYPGWENAYRPLLSRTLPAILADQTISIKRLALRFINDIPTPNIFEVTGKFTNEPLVGFETDNKAMRWTLRHKDANVVLNLASHLRQPNEKSTKHSVVDIDISQPVDEANVAVEKLLQTIDELHVLNKQLLFGHLLPESFVAKYGPSY